MIIVRQREKYFSSQEEYNIWLEEKRYNIISDLYHSGLKRTYKKNIGKLRSKVADSLSSKSLEHAGENQIISQQFLSDKRIKNEGVKKGIIKKAIKDGDTRISRTKLDSLGGPYTGENKALKESLNDDAKGQIKALNKPKDYKKTIKSLSKDKHKHQIFIPKGNGKT